jgi:hypothetical protein
MNKLSLQPLQVLLSSNLQQLSPQYVWLGGGEVDLKLRIPVKQLVLLLGSRPIACTIPRGNDNDDSD